MDPTPITAGPRLKVQRANSHIDDLRKLITPLDRKFHETVVQTNRKEGNGKVLSSVLIYRPTQPIPENLALVIGDAIHNLRAALDHLATGICSAHPNPPKSTNFPMASERKSLESDKRLSLIEQALPGSKKLLLDEIRPANGSNEKFWQFNKIDNMDKHELIVPTVTIVGIRNISIKAQGLAIKSCV